MKTLYKINVMNSACKMAVVVLLLSCSLSSYAQQDPAYSFFMYNGLAINPAVAGSSETFSASALYRKQWAGIQGAPETQTLNLDGLAFQEKVGLGLSIINDKIGVTQNLNINGQYAYRIKFITGTLSLGLQAGMNNYKADYTSVNTNAASALDQSFSENTNRMIFNFGSGAFYYTEKFYAGFSVPHILNQSLDGISDQNSLQSKQYRHYFLTTGYVFTLNDHFKMKPSTLLKIAEGAPLQVELNSNFWYNDMFCLGFSYRTRDSFTTLLQIQLKNIRVGYAYDYITSSLSRFTTGNNEIMIRYEMPKKNKKILTPRYF